MIFLRYEYDYALNATGVMANVRNASLDSFNFCIGTEAGALASYPSMRDRWFSRPGVLTCFLDNPRSHLPPLPGLARRT